MKKWIKIYDPLFNSTGAWMIKEDDKTLTPVAIIPEPLGIKSNKQRKNAQLITMAPELFEALKNILADVSSNSEYVRAITLRRAKEVIIKIETDETNQYST